MFVALVAAIDIGALDSNAGQALDLLDLPGQGTAVVGTAGQCLHSDDELAAGGACVGDRNRCIHSELVAGSRLTLGDAFDLGHVQGAKLVGIAFLLSEDLRYPDPDAELPPQAADRTLPCSSLRRSKHLRG